ncbi:MAG: Ig-like domain-containing protein [Anaerolineales bacterium]
MIRCGGNATGTEIWIDAPLNNLTFTDIQPISIEGHASSPAGIEKIEITVNGELVKIINDLPTDGSQAQFQTAYNPTGPGEYTIEAVATSFDNEVSVPDIVTVTIAEALAADTSEPNQPQIADTPTPVLPSTEGTAPNALQVHFWADPSVIRAGNCTTLHWDVSNALDVVFRGFSREFTGSEAVCQCTESTYPLTVISLDGVPEVFQVTVSVKGKCASSVLPTSTPTLAPDTVGPPTPTQVKPIDTSSLSCVADTMLQWRAVYDPSRRF